MSSSDLLQDVPLSSIFADEDFNSRGYITPSSVESLSADIEAIGLQQPIRLQPYADLKRPYLRWKIVMGHRRFLAVQLLCKRRPDLPATIAAICGPPLDEETAIVANAKENLEREPLTILQEAKVIAKFKDRGWDVATISKALGRPKMWVSVRLSLLVLPEAIQKRAEAGWLTQYDIETLAGMSTDDERIAFTRSVVDRKLKREKEPKVTKKRGRMVKRILNAKGQLRSIDQIVDLLDAVQDASGDVAHPAAMALSFVAGIITEEEFWDRVKLKKPI